MNSEVQKGMFNKQYSVMIDTVPLPDRPAARAGLVMECITPAINQILSDAISVAIGTWPTPDRPAGLNKLLHKVAKHILQDRSGANYYQDAKLLTDYLQGSLNLSDALASRLAADINEDRNSANYYSNEDILQEYLDEKITNKQQGLFNKQYRVMIDTVPLPDKPADRVSIITRSVSPVINQIISDAMNVAIGTWPTPEKVKDNKTALDSVS